MTSGPFGLTGNVFVDTGLAVLASLANLDDAAQLTLADVRQANVHGDGRRITEHNARSKSFTQIFGTNGPLFQGKKKGEAPSVLGKGIYRETLKQLLDDPGGGSRQRCQACGRWTDLDFARCRDEALGSLPADVAVPDAAVPPGRTRARAEESAAPGRDWFPLVGSLGSDAQALPGASRALTLCPTCLFAVHYLPLALLSMQGRLAIFQCVSRSFWYDLVRTQVEEARARAATGDYETPGFGEGARAVVARIMALGRTLKHHVRTRAEGVVRTAGLRTLDAIHVATAVLVSSELGSPLAYVTADRAQASAARDAGLKVVVV